MNSQTHQAQQRRIRERALLRRRKELGFKLQILGDALCESHTSPAKWQGILHEALQELLKAFRMPLLDDKRRAALAQHFHDSPARDPVNNRVGYDGNTLVLDGHFDMKALAQRMLWIGVQEQYVTVGDESEEPQSRWGFDPAIELAICLLAETPASTEVPVSAGDDLELDQLIFKAREIRSREECALLEDKPE